MSEEWGKIRAWKFLLLGGEVQIYSSEHVHFFIKYANPWELRRDPQLVERVNFPLELKNDETLTVFFVRTLLADKALRREPAVRKKKWSEHFRAFGWTFPEEGMDWSQMLRRLAETPTFRPYSVEDIDWAITQPHAIPTTGSQVNLQRLIYANSYLWGLVLKDDDQDYINKSDESVHRFLYQQLRWEIWGLSPYTLFTQELGVENLKTHQAYQMALARMLPLRAEEMAGLQEGWDKLMEFYR